MDKKKHTSDPDQTHVGINFELKIHHTKFYDSNSKGVGAMGPQSEVIF